MRSKTFLRYILSYSLILFLPLLLLCLGFYTSLLSKFTEEITQSNNRVLTQVQERFDEQLEQLVLLSYLIQNNSALHPASIGSDIIAARNAVSTLSTYKGMTTLPEVIMVATQSSDLLYTNTGVLSQDRFFNQQYVYNHHTIDDFHAAISHPASIVTWCSDKLTQYGGQSGNYITLFVAVRQGNLTPKMRTVYLIPVKRLQKAAQSIAAEYSGHVYIFDQYGESIMTYHTTPLPPTAESILLVHNQGEQQILTDSGSYFLTSADSRIAGWKYVVAIPAAAVEAPMQRILARMTFLLLAICTLGGLAVYWFSLRQYKPLHQLSQQALACVPVGHGTEVEQVSAALRQLAHNSDSYRLQLENSREATIQNTLARLLYGRSDSTPLITRAREHGIDLIAQQPWTIVVIDFSRPMDAASLALLRTALLSESFDFADSILCENPPDGNLLALFVPHTPNASDWEMRLFPLQAYLKEACACEVAFGVSCSVDAHALAEGYQQAIGALARKLLLGSSCIAVYSSEQSARKGQTRYPLQELEQLQWHLLQLDADATTECIHTIMAQITNDHPPFPVARMICFDVLSVTLHSLYEMTEHEHLHPTESMLEQLAGFNTIAELTALLGDLVSTACDSIRQMRSGNGDERVQWIRKYVEENCFNADFSIYTTAEHFGLTTSNLSHYFKNLTGESISDYVQALRRAEACRLLTQTDCSVQEIGQRIGMLNVSSFIRSFKQQTGMTPGQYRTHHGKKTPGDE